MNVHGLLSAPFLFPTAIGFAGAILCLLDAGITWASLASASFLPVAAMAAGWRLVRREAALLPSRVAAVPAAQARLREVCLRSFSVWAKQIETSRREGDDAAHKLTQLFGSTVRRLSATMTASREAVAEVAGEGGGVLDAISRSESDLQGVTQTLKDLQSTKDKILEEVQTYAADLREMSREVQEIAMQVRLLSFNAAIESARAGESGRSFAVVAAEMRGLSARSAETGARMTKKVELIHATLGQFLDGAQQAADVDAGSIATADSAMREVLERFRQLTSGLSRSVGEMEGEAAQVREAIAAAIEQLQYQDRVSQILSHVSGSLGTLRGKVADGPESVPDAEEWEREMASEFSCHEEFDNLRGTHGATRAIRETTFF